MNVALEGIDVGLEVCPGPELSGWDAVASTYASATGTAVTVCTAVAATVDEGLRPNR